MVDYIGQSERWVEEFVIKHQICPFAKEPFENDKIDWRLLSVSKRLGEDLKSVLEEFVENTEFDTNFLVIPGLTNFDDFVEVFYFIQEIAVEIKVFSVQFVSFHPESKYGDSDERDAVNFANRSPYPMIQLLRKSDLDGLDLSKEDKAGILDRNKALLDDYGYDKLLDRLNGYREQN